VKNIFKAGFVLASLAILSVAAVAAPLTGTWHGRIRFDITKLPNPTDPNQKKLMLAQIKAQEQMTMTLTLNSNHSYSINTVGSTKQVPQVGGTWNQVGNSLTIQQVKDGKTGKQSAFTLAKDGKSLTYTQGPVTVMFFR